MEPTFRLATLADVENIAIMMREFYALDEYPFDEPAAHIALSELLSNASLGRIWLILAGEQLAGYVVITFGFSLEYHGRDAFVDELFLRSEYRQQGLGSKVMQYVLDACPGLGIHALHLEVERTNQAGQRLYHKFGFAGNDRAMLTRWIMK